MFWDFHFKFYDEKVFHIKFNDICYLFLSLNIVWYVIELLVANFNLLMFLSS